jgi:hypothetical protein
MTDDWHVEAVIGGVSKPRVSVPRGDVPEEFDGEYYASWIGEKAGQYYTPWVIWDVDNNDPEKSLLRTRELVFGLLAKGVLGSALRVVFSTRKGFHVYLDSRVLGMTPSENLHEKIKRFAKILLPECDGSLYDKRHIIGVPNSIHRTTGLYYAPLTLDELFELSLAQMRKHAEHPHEFDYREESMPVCEELSRLYHVHVEPEKPKHFPSLSEVRRNVNSAEPSFFGVSQGSRDRAMFDLAVRYKSLGLSIWETHVLLLDANTRNEPPLPRDTIRKKVNSVYSREGVQI